LIHGAFHHLPGLGPKRIQEIQRLGIADWEALAENLTLLGIGKTRREQILENMASCHEAVAADNIGHLVRTYAPKDQWRILNHYLERASYFDIETSGLGPGSYITLIACLHRGKVYTFMRNENLDDFQDLLDDIELLVSFNGASFDVPQVQSHFGIPDIPCPHLDLRWACYHEELRGGLKRIEGELGIERPADLIGVDGAEAVWLWEDWDQDGNRNARNKLIRYCCADVLSLQLLAGKLLHIRGCSGMTPPAVDMWKLIPAEE